MCVVVTEPLRGVELIHGDSALLAEEQLCHRPIVYCVNGCVSGGKDIDRLVAPGAAVTSIAELPLHRASVGLVHRQTQRRWWQGIIDRNGGASRLHRVSSGGCVGR